MDVVSSGFMLRTRHFWESVDLGSVLYRRFLGPIMAGFGTIFITLCAIILFFVPQNYLWLAILLVIWLKPLWERLILAHVGLLFFQPKATAKTLFQALGQVFSLRFFFKELTFGRFVFWRTYLQPVDMFEKPLRPQRKGRRNWLLRNLKGSIFGLNMVFYTMELVIFLLLIISCSAFSLSPLIDPIAAENPFASPSVNSLCYFLTLLIVQPLYTLANFACYINHRTIHEAWDLRLAFRRLRQGLHKTGGFIPALILGGLLLLSPNVASAQEQVSTDANYTDSSSFRDRLDQTLEKAEFGGPSKRYILQFKKDPKEPEEEPEQTTLPSISTVFLAETIRLIAIIVGAVGLVFLVIFLIRRRSGMGRSKEPKPEAEVSLSLNPSDGAAERHFNLQEARRFWDAGEQRQAFAGLYNAAISFASKRYGVTLPSSATEGRCVNLVRQNPHANNYFPTFRRVTQAWVRVSWSAIMVDTPEFESLYQALCAEEDRS